jgi:hypothetical protein
MAFRFGILNTSDNPRRIAGYETVRRAASRYDRSGTDHRASTNHDTFQDDDIGANPRILANADTLTQYLLTFLRTT